MIEWQRDVWNQDFWEIPSLLVWTKMNGVLD